MQSAHCKPDCRINPKLKIKKVKDATFFYQTCEGRVRNVSGNDEVHERVALIITPG